MSNLSKKPCPGCGSTVGRVSTEVCYKCRAKLDTYQSLIDALAAADIEQPLVILKMSHGEEAFGYGLKGEDVQHSSAQKPAATALMDMIRALSMEYKPAKHIGRYSGDAPIEVVKRDPKGEDYWFQDLRIIPRAAVEPIRRAYDLIWQLLQQANREGVEYGQSIVLQLADGSITAEEFYPKEARED